ncbi:MAG: hypothetical protein K0Q73_1151 [Paenibacillus sp.]|jgi:hypothetical protein|nr:hypothetical protein [Paenibacillus sp.]
MSILEDLTTLLNGIPISVETGVFSETAPEVYTVLTPIADTFGYHADNRPKYDVQEARISLFSKTNYRQMKNRILNELIDLGFTVTDRRYLGHEDDTGYHHYAMDVAKHYGLEE